MNSILGPGYAILWPSHRHIESAFGVEPYTFAVAARRALVIAGAGDVGREVVAILRDLEQHSPGEWELVGFLDVVAAPSPQLQRLGVPVLGSERDAEVIAALSLDCAFVVATGSGSKREQLCTDLTVKGLEPISLVHPSAVIGPDCRIGAGSVIYPQCVLTTNVTLGLSVLVNPACTIAHDVELQDFSTLSPGVNLAGNVVVERLSTVFTAATVVPGIRLGARSRVGAGAVVISDVQPETTVVGVPARVAPTP
jgi:sugar O-acyltransferase (sialic acid O-acetyltransferase NeuD family)